MAPLERPETTDRKSVSFNSLEIREYPIILGDNPSVSSGIPITIAWDHYGCEVQSVDDYEKYRHPRRDMYEMRLPAKVRIRMAMEGSSKEEMRAVFRSTMKIQKQRNATVATLDTPFETAGNAYSSVRRKMSKTITRVFKKSADL
mmetsp:Transcript_16335/g.21338  ORF Transcript_16335/g.21338 Transcript_16335/m.21338 type:complete len:145 (+) Transcript_16335:183-617(+)|eukprot:CAMPEP_0116054704 /NCGR_PEP_ID=MMETSP0322-20121206/2965_1 /TAXON_ID=163516 /ORGANISM="Leptocylindrus danicus var. apora, Strain B651" /LENGTH=144 /DNA_ID=CAMNT_0003538157 /DNA_START=148 /DNA_END=582 /DNA_ORIENTATION=+